MTKFDDMLDLLENEEDNWNNFEYNDDLGCEKLNMEYKLFTLNPLLIEQDDALELLRNGKWAYSQSIIESIKTYIRVYLPKYIASYTHPLTNIKSGDLYIGVDDDGIIYGIPYLGTIPSQIIQDEINNVINSHLRVKGNNSLSVLDLVKKNVTFELLPISKGKFNARNEVYEKYIEKHNLMIAKHQTYLQKKKTWENLIYSFTKKLHNMLNNPETRRDIIMFIKEKSGYLKKSFNTKYSRVYHLCDFRDYYDFTSEIRSDFQYKSMKHETIDQMKNNPTNIFYWVTKWKDSKTSIIKDIKPSKSFRVNTNKNYPFFLLSQVHRMIPYWCTVNPELKLHLLKINIKSLGDNDIVLEYKDPNGNWNESYRKIVKGEPMSFPTDN